MGHVTLGVIMVRDGDQRHSRFPDVLRTQIEHMVVSHHGHKEFGAPVEPMTIEAMILSAADDLDAKINQVRPRWPKKATGNSRRTISGSDGCYGEGSEGSLKG